MKPGLRLTVTIVLVLSLSILQVLPVTRVYASHPTDLWRPYGPYMDNVLVTVYSDEIAEFNDFASGNLDLTDWPVFPADEPVFGSNPAYHLTSPIGELGMFDIQFNQANSFWGIPFDHARIAAASGREIRMAIAHLLDKDSYITEVLQGRGEKLDHPVPPAQGLGGPPTAPWDTLHPGTISAYNLGANTGGVAQPGSPDFNAARDHLLRVTSSSGAQVFFDSNNDGIIDNPPATQILFYIRGDHQPRFELGQRLAAAIESIFGGANVVNEQIVDITQVSDIVFRTSPATTDWHMYTGGWRLGAFWDHLYALYDSRFASNLCGGKKSQFAQNYEFVCMPDFDVKVRASIAATSFTDSANKAREALDIFGQRVATIPVYSTAARLVYKSGWAGIINQLGVGPSNPFSLLNARPDGTRPEVPAIPDTIRWGFKQGTSRLNIFHSQTLWEFFILLELYDSMLAANPRNAGQLMDWMTNKHQVFTNPTPQQLGYPRPGGSNTTIRFFLKNNLYWHDGVPLTAADVKFSVLNYRDVPSANLLPLVSLVVDATVVSSRIVDVHLEGFSIFHELNIGGLPIIPKHLWDLDHDGFADFDKINPAYDPMTAGILVGSGPFMCKHRDTGVVGGGCSENADGSLGGQSITAGGRFLLSKFDRTSTGNPALRYIRSIASFADFSWADSTNDVKIDIVDIAGIAICFDQPASGPCAYWDKPFGTTPGTIDIGELAEVASRFEETWVAPFRWTDYNDIDAFTP